MSARTDEAQHFHPVWRDRANFLIGARIPDLPGDRWEQLWARQVAEDRFEICCIPFFLKDIGLGDIVSTETVGDDRYVVTQVVFDAGWYVFRIWYGSIADPARQHQIMDEVEDKLNELGCEMERYSHDFLAVAIIGDNVQAVADYLHEQGMAGNIEYDTGRSHDPFE